jgi:NADH-quinone oxidoreductase subunit N
MTQLMMQYLSPLLIVAFGIVLSLLLIAWRRSQKLILHFTLAIFVCALLSSIYLVSNTIDAVQITALIKGDNYAYIAFILILLVSMVVGFLSSSWLRHSVEVHDEFFVLLQLVVLGSGVVVMSDHFAALFLGFELLSIALVGMVGYSRGSKYGVESAFKYLVLSATASSFMLLGIAFVYSQSGSLSFSVDAFSIAVNGQLYFVGFLLFIVGVAFKLSLAPFHFWTPDVYQGAPTSVTLLLATVSKVAMFVVLMKYWFSQSSLLVDSASNFHTLVGILAVLSMLTGNFLALKQQNIKRLLAYSSIAHMGYLLMVLLVVFPQSVHLAWQSALFYLIAYVIATISLFIALQLSEGKNANIILDGEQAISDWQGMFWHNRVLALLIIVAILSLAGIPLTAGFIGKFYVLNTAVQAQQWWLITTLIVGSGIGLFYYLKIIFTLFDGVNQEQSMYLTNAVVPTELSPVVNLSVILIILAGVILGVYPDIVSQML